MNTFDSRILGNTDCYGQRFSRPGTYRYAVTRAAVGGLSADPPFVVKVGRGDGPPRQHHVAVRLDGHHLVADPPELSVSVGDFVLWNAPDPGTPAYVVEGEKGFFSSSSLRSEAGYSHAFGLPGEYPWRDANGTVGGVVRVAPAECDSPDARRRWLDRLRTGTLVMVNGDDAEPREVEIVVGQTVFFVIGKADGVTITDARLLPERAQPPDDCGPPKKARRPRAKAPARRAAAAG